MCYRKIFTVIILVYHSSLLLEAQDIQIGLFYGTDIQSVVFSTIEGEYIMSGNGRQIAVIRRGSMFHIEQTVSGLAVHDTLQSYGEFNNLEFTGASGNNVFQIKPVFPSLPPKESEDYLSITITNGKVRLVNRLRLEKYIPGTVEAESGISAMPEYYKAQSVITRTFAVKNFHRHAHQGFNLCDNTHCQVFNGKSRRNTQIYTAALLTQGQILVDTNGEPVITAYHASCGGITGRSSVEWNMELPYLVPVKDPFCDKSQHRNWSKAISSQEWNAYLERKGHFAGSGHLMTGAQAGRQKYLDTENRKIPLTEVRKDLKLKSSFFYIENRNDTVTFHGHGYGHGLGLCQEGAMEMARVGYSYVDILMFYFKNVIIGSLADPKHPVFPKL